MLCADVMEAALLLQALGKQVRYLRCVHCMNANAAISREPRGLFKKMARGALLQKPLSGTGVPQGTLLLILKTWQLRFLQRRYYTLRRQEFHST